MKEKLKKYLKILAIISLFSKGLIITAYSAVSTNTESYQAGICNSPEWYENFEPLKILSWLVLLLIFLLLYLKTDYFLNFKLKNNLTKIIVTISIIFIVNTIIIDYFTFLLGY